MWARRDSSPLRQRSCPSSTPATSCSLLKVGGVCEPASPVPVICVSRGSSAVSVYVVWMVFLNRVVTLRSDPRRNTPCGGDVMQGELVGPAPRAVSGFFISENTRRYNETKTQGAEFRSVYM